MTVRVERCLSQCEHEVRGCHRLNFYDINKLQSMTPCHFIESTTKSLTTKKIDSTIPKVILDFFLVFNPLLSSFLSAKNKPFKHINLSFLIVRSPLQSHRHWFWKLFLYGVVCLFEQLKSEADKIILSIVCKGLWHRFCWLILKVDFVCCKEWSCKNRNLT